MGIRGLHLSLLAGLLAPYLCAAETVDVLSPACERSIALSAAPEYLQEAAGVYVFSKDGYVLERDTENDFTCIVNRDHPRVLKPTCFDREGTKTIIPKILYVGAALAKGTDLNEINNAVGAAFEQGTFISPRRPGIAYMLSRYNRPYNAQTDTLGFFPPHVMFYAPNLTNKDIGHDMAHHDPERPLPMIAYGGPQGYMIMLADDGQSRNRQDLHRSCPDWVFASPDK